MWNWFVSLAILGGWLVYASLRDGPAIHQHFLGLLDGQRSGHKLAQKLKPARSLKSFVWIISLFFSVPLFAFDYTNSQLGFKAKLPDGLDDFSTNMRVKALISRGRISHNGLVEMVAIQDLGGTIGREDLSKKAGKPQNATLEKTSWKAFDVDVFRIVENIGGASFVTFNAQVPLKPTAIQVTVSGPTSNDSNLRKEMQTIVASVDGSTNWLTPEERSARLQQNYLAIIIGLFALIVGKLRLTRHYGLAGTGARVAGFIILAVGLVLPKLTAPVLIFARSRGADVGVLLSTWIAFNCAVIWGIIAVLIHHYGNAYASDLAKAMPPPIPTAPQTGSRDVLVTNCPLCQSPIPPDQHGTAKKCPSCGADLTRRRR